MDTKPPTPPEVPKPPVQTEPIQSQPQAYTPNNQYPPAKKSRKTLWIILGIVGALIVTGVIIALALVSISAYNGVQERAKQTPAAEVANDSQTTETAASQCLVIADLDDEQWAGNTEIYDGLNLSTSFFKSDSTTLEFPDQEAESFDNIAKLYKNTSDKSYDITLTASVQEGELSAAGRELANKRTETVRSELTKRGISNDRLIIKEPSYRAGSNVYVQSAARNVRVDLDIADKCL